MRKQFLAIGALSLALTAGSAQAQVVQGGYINGFPAYTLAPPPIPSGRFLTPPPAFTPNPNIRIIPGYGWGSPGFGTIYPGYGYVPGGFFAYNYYNNGYLPVFGSNPPPPVNPEGADFAPGNLPAGTVPGVNGANASSRTARERRALLEAAQRQRDRETRAAREYKSLMRAKALAPGTLLSTDNNTARVRYGKTGSRKIGEFPANRVYFSANTRSGEGNRVATLATDPGLKHEGDRVMVALIRPVTTRRGSRTIVISNR